MEKEEKAQPSRRKQKHSSRCARVRSAPAGQSARRSASVVVGVSSAKIAARKTSADETASHRLF